MAFQDTSYTIVLDAVLTDIGRKRMVQGDFKVAKFALGDDEIDYMLRSPPDGGIFQTHSKLNNTPTFEAFATPTATITYGLVDYERLDILYVPELVVNSERVEESATPHPNNIHGRYHVSVNDETTKKLKLSTALSADKYILESNADSKTKLLIESGINIKGTTSMPDTKLAKERFLMQMNLYDAYYIVYADSRMIENVLCNPLTSYFKTDTSNNLYMNFEPLQRTVKTSIATLLDHHDAYRIKGTDTEIFGGNTGSGAAMVNQNSALVGPRGTIIALNFNIYNELCGDSSSNPDDMYYIFGTRNQELFSDGNLYDYIDTTIYVEGLSSNSRIQVPLRIVRYAGSNSS